MRIFQKKPIKKAHKGPDSSVAKCHFVDATDPNQVCCLSRVAAFYWLGHCKVNVKHDVPN